MTIKNLIKGSQPVERIKQLEKLVDKQAETIDRLRAAKFRVPRGRAPAKTKTRLRVLVGDTHGAHLDKQAAAAFFRDLEALRPSEIIHLGDGLDCGGFLAQHHVIGAVPELDITFEDDVAGANYFLDELERCSPGARKQYIGGNHDARIEKHIIKMVLGNKKNADFLMKMFRPEVVLNLEARGMRYINRDQKYDGLNVRGTIDLGHCLARHGTRCGVNAAYATLTDMGKNVVFGHTHRISMASRETAEGLICSWSFGCLCELHPLYGDTNISGWGHGYGLQVIGKNGFLTIQVPIINGVSYLHPLLQAARIKC